jgi:hypothetical protein
MTTRINVYAEFGELAGWFDRDEAERFEERTWWDGNNHVSVHTGDKHNHQALFRTAGGRWVLKKWSDWQNVADSYSFTDAERARSWLLKNDDDDAVERLFGPIESESGPAT